MIKNKFIKLFIISILITGCGYSPIFSNKNANFSIAQLSIAGNNNKLNKIINNKLNSYKGINSEKYFSLVIDNSSEKTISSKDSRGNAKTYRIIIKLNILVRDSNGKENEKLFIKSMNYNNNNNKSELKKYENETYKNLTKKISEEIIIYLQSI